MGIGQFNAKLKTCVCGENTTNLQSEGDTISFVFFLIVRVWRIKNKGHCVDMWVR